VNRGQHNGVNQGPLSPAIPPGSIRLVCFDWGGVILRICRDFAEACAAAGLDVRPGAEGGEHAPSRREIVRAHQEGRLEFDEYTRRISAAFGGAYSPGEIARIHDAWLLHEYEGVSTLIDDLHAATHIRTALLSNTNQRHLLRGLCHEEGGCGDFPTAHRVHHRLYSNREKCSKPGSEFYRALHARADVQPHQVLFFDDLEENIAAARGLGWHGVRVDPHGDTATQMRAVLRACGVL
jgi:putative hydrolase of the HAD superfamily